MILNRLLDTAAEHGQHPGKVDFQPHPSVFDEGSARNRGAHRHEGEVHRVAVPALIKAADGAPVLLAELGDTCFRALSGLCPIDLMGNCDGQGCHGILRPEADNK
jgi:hypothetical protein